jgi:hypothetical protein
MTTSSTALREAVIQLFIAVNRLTTISNTEIDIFSKLISQETVRRD